MRMIRFPRPGVWALALLVVALIPSTALAQAKLLLSQVEVRGGPPGASTEYVVIKNPGASPVDLSNYYLTDATFANGSQFYYNITDPALPIGGGSFGDFFARFPAGMMIQPGQELSVGINGSMGFKERYGLDPHIELWEDNDPPDNVPDMRDARPGSINGTENPGLSNSGEVVILFYWDGESPLVVDMDYVVWGDKAEGVDKSGVTIRGGTYLNDTAIASQDITSPANPVGGAFVRQDDSEGTQTATGSNGVGGRDETSENLSVTFEEVADPSPPGMEAVDTTPPALASASGEGGTATVVVTFTEPVVAGAATASNYQVFPAGNEGGAITVNSASPSGATVTLGLASSLAPAVTYTVRVSNVQDAAGNTIAANSTVDFTSAAGDVFAVLSGFQFGADYVGVTFSSPVNAASATNTANYSFNPALSITSAALQDNGQTVVLRTSSDLPRNTGYSVTVSGVTSATGQGLASGGPRNFTTVDATVTNIAEIQGMADPGLDGTAFTVVGQVFIPQSSRGGTPSGYIQDGSGRGLNVFGGTTIAALDDRANVSAVTGDFLMFFSTVELENLRNASVLASDQPFLAPKPISVAQANSDNWEGTYIQSTGEISQIITSGVGGAVNYIVSSGGSNLTMRVDNDLGINAGDYQVGETLTAAGAGSRFGDSEYQISVGNVEEFSAGDDTDPPTLASASGDGGSTQVRVNFSEAVGTGANVASNYTVAANPGASLSVVSATPSGASVTLTLGTALEDATSYTVTVSNVQDQAGNVIAPGSMVSFVSSAAEVFAVSGAFQFGADFVGVTFSKPVDAGTAANTGNYNFTPALTFSGATVQDNGQTVVLRTSSDLPRNMPYSVTVSGVTSSTGEGLVSGGPREFTTVNAEVTNIAEIQGMADPSLDGTPFTVVGQVFITQSSRGGTPSGYIQDGSGRGLNVFGGTTLAALDNRGNVSAVTGDFLMFFSTVELENLRNASVLASNQPWLAPRVLSVAQANSDDWEGTYIRSTGEIAQIITSGVGGAANYVVSSGSANLTMRVDNDLGINPGDFQVGETLTASGAGSRFGDSEYQISVGSADEFTAGDDTDPPTLTSASGDGGSTRVRVNFSEGVGTGANVASNYTVAATGGAALTVVSAVPSGSSVNLTVGTALANATSYTVTVSNVQDQAGNVIAPNSTTMFTSSAPGSFSVAGAWQFGADRIAVAYTDRASASGAVNVANYAFSPDPGIASAQLQANGQTVIFTTNSDLPRSQAYTVSVSNVTSITGGPLVGSTGSFTSSAATITNISDIQDNAGNEANPGPIIGEEVTVICQVYIPTDSRGGTPSGYIQDGSGRGINLFGNGATAAVNGIGNVVEINGDVTAFFDTIEIENYTPRLIMASMPPLAAQNLTVAAANSRQWEGTYIETSAEITSILTTGVGACCVNFIVGGGGDFLTVRIDTDLGINPNDFQVGESVTARGAGALFGTDEFQITLGNSFDLVKAGDCSGDTDPPILTNASGGGGTNEVVVSFSEPVVQGPAETSGNYRVFVTSNPSQVLSVDRATSQGSVVTLRLGGELVEGTQYTVEASNIPDLCGNIIPEGASFSFLAVEGKARTARITVEAKTFIKGLEEIEIVLDGPENSNALCRIFDTQGRLVFTLFDGVFGPREIEREWNGRDETFEFVNAGLYICHLQSTDLQGKVTTDQVPIVVAVRLN